VELVTIPGGWFWMGSGGGRGGQDDERPRHRVWVDSLEMARCQVTNREYAEFLAATRRLPPRYWGAPGFHDPDQPVVGVNWEDAAAYCRWLGDGFRLPTEAEWERAARGGRDGQEYPWGDDPPLARPGYQTRWKTGPEPVATSAPNDFGLYDMCENVHEWCLDWYDPAFYARSPERNPCCREPALRRASKGGSWRHHIKIARCAARSSIPPHLQYADYGLRVVRGGAVVG
jgi:formylglycine-generating enzyme required for sulfatase activity